MTKEQFVEALKSNGFHVEVLSHVPTIIVSIDEYESAIESLERIVEETGYVESRGVKVRRSTINPVADEI